MYKFKEVDKAAKILKLGKKFTPAGIQKAYRKLAMKYHPDRCKEKKSLCIKKFIEITNSRKILSDYLEGSYKPPKKKEKNKGIKKYKEHIEHVKRFYDGWLGDLDF